MISGEDKFHWFVKLKHIQQDLSNNSPVWWMEEVEVPSSPLSVWKAALRAPRRLVVIHTTQWAWCQRILATNAKESERMTRGSQRWGLCICALEYAHASRSSRGLCTAAHQYSERVCPASIRRLVPTPMQMLLHNAEDVCFPCRGAIRTRGV